MADPRIEKIIMLGGTLRGFEQYMTMLLELDMDILEALVDELEDRVFDSDTRPLIPFYCWVRFVRDMRSMSHLSELSWADQRPEHLKMD